MTSVRSRLLIGWFRLSGRKQVFLDTSQFDESIVDSQRSRTSKPPAALYRRHRVQRSDVRGFPCVTVAPRTETPDRHVLYLHGSAYVHSIERAHWQFVSKLVDMLAATVTVPVYPLAPDYHYDETQAMIVEAYERHMAGTDPARQIIMGDSAGGALALVLARKLREQNRPQPARLVLISPWLDATMQDPAVPALDRRDPYLSTPGSLEAGRMYAGDLDVADPLTSPLNGTFGGLDRISVFTGTRDVLLSDSRRLRQVASREGIDIDYVEYEDMFHGWMLMQRLPEARRATATLFDLLSGGSRSER